MSFLLTISARLEPAQAALICGQAAQVLVDAPGARRTLMAIWSGSW